MNKHIFSPFDNELETIQKRMLLMGEQVSREIGRALDGLADHDTALLEAVIQADKQINEEEVALTSSCIQMIVRHGPAANDLRLIMAMMQMITDLERIGDKAKKIAKMARSMVETGQDGIVTATGINLHDSAELTRSMLGQALDAFARMDTSITVDIFRQDKAVNAFFRDARRRLTAYMTDNPDRISGAIDLLFITKAIERVGDHATNLVEHVVYIVNGRNVRHTSLKNMKKMGL